MDLSPRPQDMPIPCESPAGSESAWCTVASGGLDRLGFDILLLEHALGLSISSLLKAFAQDLHRPVIRA